MNEKIKEIFDRIPFIPLIFLVLGFKAYDLYDFLNTPESELLTKKSQAEELTSELEKMEVRLKEVEKFKATIDKKREALRAAAQELESTRTSLGAEIDVASFIRMVTTEAKKLGMNVGSITPKGVQSKELFNEQSFDIQLKGIYIQTLVFLQRLSKLQNIVRIQNFSLSPVSGGRNSGRYADLSGKIEISAYSYKAIEEKKADATSKVPANGSKP